MKADLRNAYRHAVYFSPAPGDAWWRAGSRWIGRDAATGACCTPTAAQHAAAGSALASRLLGVLADPWRYGWHATLRAPFRLVDGVGPADIRDAVAALALGLQTFAMPPLAVRRLGNFLALVPRQPSADIGAVAEACVRTLQPLAAPLGAEELARRRRAPLTLRQDELLQRWGYPFVMEEFRFHFSLTGALGDMADADVEQLAAWAVQAFESLPPACFDGLSLFVEPVRGAPFELVERFPMSPRT